MPINLGFHFQNRKHFLEYFWFYLLTIVDTNKRYLDFLFYLFICQVTAGKVNFRFHKQCSQATARSVCERAISAQNTSIFFSGNIPLYSENNLVVKLCKILEMELKTYTPVCPKFVSVKIKFIVLHCIQHDFIRLVSFDMISTTTTQ